jgi:molybdopterin converting factor small subunit
MELRVNVSYLGLVRNVIGCREEEVEISPGATVAELLAHLAARHGEPFRLSVFGRNGRVRPTVLICLNDRDVAELGGFRTRLEAAGRVSVVVGVYPPEGG